MPGAFSLIVVRALKRAQRDCAGLAQFRLRDPRSPRNHMLARRAVIAIVVVLVAGAMIISWWLSRTTESPVHLAGEFEQQSGLLLSCRSFAEESSLVFVQMVSAASRHLPVVVLHTGHAERTAAEQILYAHGALESNVHFVDVPHTTMWVRDFGPFVVQDAGGQAVLVDANYEWEEEAEIVAAGRVQRVADDDFPRELAEEIGTPRRETELTIDGGHVLSNGRGLGVATLGLLEHNVHHGLDERQMTGKLCALFGFEEVVFLESLPREPTGHLDVFATFTSADTIVVGALDPNTDPHGAAALDRNAEKLSEVRVAGQPLNVVRIPLPYFGEDVWPTYTNVVYANGALLMPVYPGRDPDGRRTARETYERLLPGWEIVEVDGDWFLPRGGGPHCAILNLGGLDITPLKTGSSGRGEK